MTAVEPATPPTAATAATLTPSGTACMACGHERDAHDAIAQRFCNATVEHAFTRGCMCRVTP
jgi:hypothetical protein